MEYLNHLDQGLPVFNLNIIIERSFFVLFCFVLGFFFLGGGRGRLDGTAEKIEKQMEQFLKIIHGKIMYINKNR